MGELFVYFSYLLWLGMGPRVTVLSLMFRLGFGRGVWSSWAPLFHQELSRLFWFAQLSDTWMVGGCWVDVFSL